MRKPRGSIAGYGRYGGFEEPANSDSKSVEAFVSGLVEELIAEEFSRPDYEHAEISLTHRPTGWSLSASITGLLSLVNLQVPAEPKRELVGLSLDELRRLLTWLACGAIDEVLSYPWEEAVERPVEDLYLLAGHPKLTPLHRAAASGRLDWLKLEIERSSQGVDPPGEWGETPLHHAAMAGQAKACQLLIAAGANLDAPGAEGESVEESAEVFEFDPEPVLRVLRKARRASGKKARGRR